MEEDIFVSKINNMKLVDGIWVLDYESKSDEKENE